MHERLQMNFRDDQCKVGTLTFLRMALRQVPSAGRECRHLAKHLIQPRFPLRIVRQGLLASFNFIFTRELLSRLKNANPSRYVPHDIRFVCGNVIDDTTNLDPIFLSTFSYQPTTTNIRSRLCCIKQPNHKIPSQSNGLSQQVTSAPELYSNWGFSFAVSFNR